MLRALPSGLKRCGRRFHCLDSATVYLDHPGLRRLDHRPLHATPRSWHQAIDLINQIAVICALILFTDRFLRESVDLHNRQLGDMNLTPNVVRFLVRVCVLVLGGLILLGTLNISITPFWPRWAWAPGRWPGASGNAFQSVCGHSDCEHQAYPGWDFIRWSPVRRVCYGNRVACHTCPNASEQSSYYSQLQACRQCSG